MYLQNKGNRFKLWANKITGCIQIELISAMIFEIKSKYSPRKYLIFALRFQWIMLQSAVLKELKIVNYHMLEHEITIFFHDYSY